VSRSRSSGAITPFSLYAFTACTGTTLLSQICLSRCRTASSCSGKKDINERGKERQKIRLVQHFTQNRKPVPLPVQMNFKVNSIRLWDSYASNLFCFFFFFF
jgi:hypothetical protein